MEVSFNTSASQGESDLEYLWDFGDGTTSSDPNPSHSFAEGEHVVTLTVSDEWGQTDEYRAYIIARNENFFGQLRIDYPTQPAALRASAVYDEIDALMQQAVAAHANSKREGSGKTTLSRQALSDLVMPSSSDGTRYESTFPYVVHNSAQLQRAIFRWTPWENGSRSPYVFCEDNRPFIGNEGIHVFYNGLEWVPTPPGLSPPVFLFRANFDTLYDFCFMVQLYSSGGGYGVQARSDNAVDITAVRHDLRYSFDGFSGLRIPKVHLSIVPDQLLPGDLASPLVTENTYTGEDGEQLALSVQVRESEAQGKVSFDLPVYAVDQNGAQVDATGYFQADIEGVEADCGDCIMVNGKATMRVTIPVAKGASFNLTEFKLYTTESCDFDRAWTDTRFGYLRGCTDVTATHKAPTGLQDVEPFPFPPSPEALVAFDTVAQGGDTEERKAFYKHYADTSIKVVKFGLNFLPFISDGADLLGQLYNSAIGADVDPILATIASAGLILDVTTGGFGDITAPIKGVYKFSKEAAENGLGGAMAQAIGETITNAITAGKGAKAVIDDVTLVFGTAIEVTFKCGFKCLGQADSVTKQITDIEGDLAREAFKALDTGIDGAKRADIPARCFLAVSEILVESYSLVDISRIFLGFEPAAVSQSLLETLQNNSKKCSYDTFRINIATKQHKKYRDLGIPDSEIDKLTPHHIVPFKENAGNAPGRCRSNTNGDVCTKARDILKRLGIDFEQSADNGVLLPMQKRLRDDEVPEFNKKYPCATVHTTRLNNADELPVFHTLEYYEQVYDDLNLVDQKQFENPQDKVAEIRSALQDIASQLLEGDYVPQVRTGIPNNLCTK